MALLLTACAAVGSNVTPPKIDLPAQFQGHEQAGLSSAPAELAGWWQRLDDPVLERLIERSARESLDLREALARLNESRALRGSASADRFPSLDAKASYLRRGESDNTPLGSFVPDNGVYTVGFDATWELDVWGRVRRSVEAADADLAASELDVRDVSVTVAAEIARNYVDLRAFQRRSEIAKNNVSLQEQTLELVRGRYSAGLVGERDVAQALTNVESTRSRVPAFEVGVRAAENRLAVLLGRAPGALGESLDEARPIPLPPLQLAVGVPADLLRRRADVRRAERELAAAHARIGVAEGDLYPRLTLGGELGLAADDLSKLGKSDSTFFGIGPSLRWHIFDAGRVKNGVRAQEARTDQAQARWERSVLVALEEAENSMTGFVREQTRHASLLEATNQSRRAVDFSRAEYREGLSDFQSVLTSERALADLEDELATSEAAIATQFVALYKALGGGWENGGAAPAAPR